MSKTKVAINSGKFSINGEYTYKSRIWKGIEIEGMLLNSRMVQGIYDDKNPNTVQRWAYPDTGIWDAQRNTFEFIQAMASWREHGLLCITLNLQGGSPEGYSKEQAWHNSAFMEDGSLDEEYMLRLEQIADKADELGMVIILGLFYFGQENRLRDEEAIKTAARNAAEWVLGKGYENIIIEINNECDIIYEHPLLKADRVHELIRQVKHANADGRQLLVSASFSGGSIPGDNVIEASDFILIHGNGVNNTDRIEDMIRTIRGRESYKGQPVLFNEDDHFDFDQPDNNFIRALKNNASWGYFDPGSSNYNDGYQCPPVNWGINTQRKKDFFELLRQITQE